MKITLKENYRVVVEPNRSYWTRGDLKELEEEKRNTCESIVDDIKRHVDDVNSVEVIFDESEICEFCQTEWEVWEEEEFEDGGYIKGEPVCCNKAGDEFRIKEAIENDR